MSTTAHPSISMAELIAAARRDAAHAPVNLAGLGSKIECLARLAVAQHQIERAQAVAAGLMNASAIEGGRS